MTKTEWYADRDPDAREDCAWQPVLIESETNVCVTSACTWFRTEEECVDFIKGYLIGATLDKDIKQSPCEHTEQPCACENPIKWVLDFQDRQALARELCDTYYLTVDPQRPMQDAFSKVTEKTRDHWRAQAQLMIDRNTIKEARDEVRELIDSLAERLQVALAPHVYTADQKDEEGLNDAGRQLRSLAASGSEVMAPWTFVPCAREHEGAANRLCIREDGHA